MQAEQPRITRIFDNHHSKSALIGFPLLMLASCGTFSRIEDKIDHAAAARYARTGNLQTEVDALAQSLIEEKRTPGFVVGVLRPDGSAEYFGYGVVARHGDRPPDGDTLFAIGSTSKGFLSATAAVLAQEGTLSWTETLADVLPDDIPLSRDAAKITLEQLATHASGLPRQPMTPRTMASFIQYLFTGKSFYRHFDREYVLRYLARFNAPADSEQYSNIAFGVLGYALELRSGKNLDLLMREKLLQPLQLQATGFDPRNLPGYSERALPHSGDQPKFIRRGKPVPNWWYTDIMLGSAGLYSTAKDLLGYARGHLHPTGIEALDQALLDTLTARTADSGIKRAPSWSVDNVESHEITYQIGFTGGYSAYIGMDRTNQTAVVVLQNSLNWSESIGHRLLLLMARAAALSPRPASGPN